MSDAEFKEYIFQQRDQWAQGSNESDDQEKIAEAGESFIAALDAAIILAGGHPDPPPPRVR